LLLILIYKL